MFVKGDLFFEPPKLHPESEFEVDGVKVRFWYVTSTMPCFGFSGDVSETGYMSDYPFPEWLDEIGVEALARERIEALRAEFYKTKKNRKEASSEKGCCLHP